MLCTDVPLSFILPEMLTVLDLLLLKCFDMTGKSLSLAIVVAGLYASSYTMHVQLQLKTT